MNRGRNTVNGRKCTVNGGDRKYLWLKGIFSELENARLKTFQQNNCSGKHLEIIKTSKMLKNILIEKLLEITEDILQKYCYRTQ